jgi:hypothetical protein
MKHCEIWVWIINMQDAYPIVCLSGKMATMVHKRYGNRGEIVKRKRWAILADPKGNE